MTHRAWPLAVIGTEKPVHKPSSILCTSKSYSCHLDLCVSLEARNNEVHALERIESCSKEELWVRNKLRLRLLPPHPPSCTPHTKWLPQIQNHKCTFLPSLFPSVYTAFFLSRPILAGKSVDPTLHLSLQYEGKRNTWKVVQEDYCPKLLFWNIRCTKHH